MLDPNAIRLLPSAEKAVLVRQYGHYLHYRIKGWCKIDLYKVAGPAGSYFVELWYYYDLKTVGLVRIFESMPPLEPYLDNIKLKVE
ncbi:MAG TPA: hypothetical protein VK927_08340 [Adhaeribacter sp.]|nr:hypothetical protein [Adhaeribacter sp.]